LDVFIAADLKLGRRWSIGRRSRSLRRATAGAERSSEHERETEHECEIEWLHRGNQTSKLRANTGLKPSRRIALKI
jgi:hypothetical protein